MFVSEKSFIFQQEGTGIGAKAALKGNWCQTGPERDRDEGKAPTKSFGKMERKNIWKLEHRKMGMFCLE